MRNGRIQLRTNEIKRELTFGELINKLLMKSLLIVQCQMLAPRLDWTVQHLSHFSRINHASTFVKDV